MPRVARASKKDACAEAAEDQRLKREDLVQQTRAADASQAAAIAAIDGNRLALAGVLVGLLTLAAAAYAAWWAREAARETRASAKAAEKALSFMAETNAADLRPYLFIDRLTFKPGEHGDLKITIHLKNFGKIPARSIQTSSLAYYTADLSDLRSLKDVRPTPVPVCAPGHERRFFDGCWLSLEHQAMIDRGQGVVVVRVKYRYFGRGIKRFTESADYVLDRQSLEAEGVAFILTDDSRVARQTSFHWRREIEAMQEADEGECPDDA